MLFIPRSILKLKAGHEYAYVPSPTLAETVIFYSVEEDGLDIEKVPYSFEELCDFVERKRVLDKQVKQQRHHTPDRQTWHEMMSYT